MIAFNFWSFFYLQVLKNIEEIADLLGLRYSRKPRDQNPIEYYSSDSEAE